MSTTNGASQSFSNIITLFTRLNLTRIFIEDPTYFLALRVLNDHGFSTDQLSSIPLNEDGIRTEILDDKLRQMTKEGHEIPEVQFDGRFQFMLYLVPTFSNPTGFTLSSNRRTNLVRIVMKYNVLVVCDDVYHCFNDTTQEYIVPERLVSLDVNSLQTKDQIYTGNVISNCSLSKIISPGFRLG